MSVPSRGPAALAAPALPTAYASPGTPENPNDIAGSAPRHAGVPPAPTPHPVGKNYNHVPVPQAPSGGKYLAPAVRKKGSTRLKAIEEAVLEAYGPKVPTVLGRLYMAALKGNVAAAKEFLDRVVGKAGVKVPERPQVTSSSLSKMAPEAVRELVANVIGMDVKTIAAAAAERTLTIEEGRMLVEYMRALTPKDPTKPEELDDEELQQLVIKLSKEQGEAAQVVAEAVAAHRAAEAEMEAEEAARGGLPVAEVKGATGEE